MTTAEILNCDAMMAQLSENNVTLVLLADIALRYVSVHLVQYCIMHGAVSQGYDATHEVSVSDTEVIRVKGQVPQFGI